MNAFLIMLKNVVIFVLLAVPGYLLVKTKTVKPSDTGILSTLLSWVGMPFLILSGTLTINFTGEFTRSLLIVGAVGLLFILLMILLSAILTKKDGGKTRGIMRFAMIFANSGFLGIPLASAVFGSNSPIVIYIILLNILSNLLMFTVGVYLVSGDKSYVQVKKALLNPILIAFILGIILNLTGVLGHLPELLTFSDYFKHIVTPISMTVLGMKLGTVRFSSLFSRGGMYYTAFVRLVAFPVLSVVLLWTVGLFMPVDTDMLLGTMIAFACPTAAMATAFADQYNGDTENAVIYTLGNTVLSVITIPLLYWALTALF